MHQALLDISVRTNGLAEGSAEEERLVFAKPVVVSSDRNPPARHDIRLEDLNLVSVGT